MNIVVLDTSGGERDRIVRTLGALGHSVSAPASPVDLEELVADPARRPDVCIANLSHPPTSDLARTVVAARCARHIYLIGNLLDLSERRVTEAFELGADDVMRRGASCAEIVGRVEAINRIKSWCFDYFASSDAHREHLEVIGRLGALVADDMGVLLGAALTTTPLVTMPALSAAAEVTLASAGLREDVVIGLGVEPGHESALCTAMLGEPGNARITRDIVRELANTAAGTFKRHTLVEHVNFSISMPRDLEAFPPDAHQERWRLSNGSLQAILWASRHSEDPHRIPAVSLEPGMVLAQEVRNSQGMLLIAAGTVLTDRTVRRLVDLVGPRALVEVMRAA